MKISIEFDKRRLSQAKKQKFIVFEWNKEKKEYGVIVPLIYYQGRTFELEIDKNTKQTKYIVGEGYIANKKRCYEIGKREAENIKSVLLEVIEI